MTATLAELNATLDEETRLHTALAEAIKAQPPSNWRLATLDEMGLDAWDRLELLAAAETQFNVLLDDHLAGEHTVADLLAAVRVAARPGELPHG
jgi:hypothetical protein